MPVTVLMPVYNAGKYLRQSIESVLAQTYGDFEFLIINDGSTDDTAQIVRSYSDSRIRFVENESNTGMVATLNRGLSLATHKLVARMDGDDISLPQRLEKQVACFSQNEKLALLGSRCGQIDENGVSIYMGALEKPLEPVTVKWYQLFDNPFTHTSVMYKKNVVFDDLGGYRWSDICADYDLWARIAESGYEAQNLPDRLVDYRTHSSSIIGALRAKNEEKLKIAAKERREIAKRAAKSSAGWDMSDDEADTLQSFVYGHTAQTAGKFIETFDKALAMFVKENPEAKSSADFRETVAGQYCTVAYQALAGDRGLSAQIYAKGVKYHPPIAIKLPWGRITALALFGEKAREMYGKVRAR
ncbi:MAG: glycosyltransferase [Nitrospinae bacterium]|nr:glycosyltransferase [Nitrospinota bacterium]